MPGNTLIKNPDNVTNPTQYQRFMYDLEMYPNSIVSTYKGINYTMRRPGGTYWCGYVQPSPDVLDTLTDDDYEQLEEILHGGITSGPLGFDCCHYDDYSYCLRSHYEFSLSKEATYKDHDFVLNIIHKAIDYIVNK